MDATEVTVLCAKHVYKFKSSVVNYTGLRVKEVAASHFVHSWHMRGFFNGQFRQVFTAFDVILKGYMKPEAYEH